MDEPKERLRSFMRGRLARIDQAERRERSAGIAARLLSDELWREAGVLLSYLALPSEVDTEPINREALRAGKILALPRIEGAGLSYRVVAGLEGPWQRNAYRIREPGEQLPPLPLAGLLAAGTPLLLLVPGLAFDREGGRLGRGKGFYDRFLASLDGGRPSSPGSAQLTRPAPRGVTSLGVCYAEQIVPDVPTEMRDRRVDRLLTDAGLTLCEWPR